MGSRLKSLAYQLAKKNKKDPPFKDNKAGKDWLFEFLKRHPDLMIRKPENTSAARAGFNKIAVDNFYKLLGEIYDKHQLTPDRIFNCDETGMSVVPKTKCKIIAKTGRKQMGALLNEVQRSQAKYASAQMDSNASNVDISSQEDETSINDKCFAGCLGCV